MTLYIPKHFAEPRIEIVHQFLRANPFCSLVTSSGTGLSASHLPMVLDTAEGKNGMLRGHLARANPHSQGESVEALAIFSGADAYVSPSYYPSKLNDPRTVPTWNYTVVHIAGKIRFIDDPEFVRRNVAELTALMESGRKHPWKIEDAPDDYLAKMLRAIVGVEVEIHDMQAKFKLSQNHTHGDIKGVIDGLMASPTAGDSEVGEIMKHVTGES